MSLDCKVFKKPQIIYKYIMFIALLRLINYKIIIIYLLQFSASKDAKSNNKIEMIY